MNTTDFTQPDDLTAVKLLVEALVFVGGFWVFFIKADWVGEFSTAFLPGSGGPVTATPGWLLKPFGLLSLVMALVCAHGFAATVLASNDSRKPEPKTRSSQSSK